VTENPRGAGKVGNLAEAAEGFENMQDELRRKSRENGRFYLRLLTHINGGDSHR